ncbi:MAG TPA: NADH-quinone oxidoreductase subunit M [Solirubrobacterales bacterium]|jgi:NADH-quinone oxidoreductase subunit M
MLNVLLWLPLAVALVAVLMPRRAVAPFSFLGSLVTLGLAIALVVDFDSSVPGLQHEVSENWIPDLGISYALGVDGISLFLVLLTALLWSASFAFAAWRQPERRRNYFFMLGLAETGTLGAFLAQDLVLFVLFFDLMLVPFFFLIGAYGTGNRVQATIKMMIYTLVGSLLMLVGAIATGILVSEETGELSFALADLRANLLSEGTQDWIFCFFAAAFLVKMPAIPLHGWVPDAYRAAPLPVLALLSGVLSKVAAYGFLRVVFPIFPDAALEFQELVMIVAVASILYGSAMAFTQTNLRMIIAYSSIAQMGFITLGLFALTADGADGAVLHMINHGLVAWPVFFIIALLYERYGSEDLREMGGGALRAPVFATLFMIVTLALLAMPGSANFIGEFYILNAVFQEKVVYAIVASVGIAMAAFYALRMYQRTMHNRLPEGKESREISLRDGAVLAPMVAVIVGLALYPGLVLERGEASVQDKVGAVLAAAECEERFYASDGDPVTPAVAGIELDCE